MLRKRENKNYYSVSFLPDGQEKIQKFKITVMASFQAKIGWKMMRKREIKNCLSVPFQPDGKEKIPKK